MNWDHSCFKRRFLYKKRIKSDGIKSEASALKKFRIPEDAEMVRERVGVGLKVEENNGGERPGFMGDVGRGRLSKRCASRGALPEEETSIS
jgi:hypothetical protein